MIGIDYTGDPRATLCHEGNENSGRYRRGSGERPFQHVSGSMRKYVASDGSLTKAGRARWEHDKRRNAQKKKDDQVKDENKLIDPHRWVKEDLDSYQETFKQAQGLTSAIKNYEEKRLANRTPVRRKTLDLSNMTDTELRAQIDRYLLEQRYQDTFNPKVMPEVSKGRKWLMRTLETTGAVLAVGSSAVMIAKALHDMKAGS